MNNYKKEQINIDTVCKYSTDDIFNILKNYIEYKEKIYHDDGDEIDLRYRLLIVCGFTRYLTDEKLLNHTLDVLRKFDLINGIENTGIDLSSYSENEITKIKAIYYSLTSMRKLSIKYSKFPNSKTPKQLDIKLKKRVIEHNLQEVLNSIQMNNVFQFEEIISKYPINTQKNEINKWIRSALKVGRYKETKMFDVEMDYLKDISDHLIEPEKSQPEPVKPNKAIKAKKEFKDFFNPDVSIEAIQKIHEEFKDCSGKKMACLIYLLHKEFKLINYTINSKDMARIHFVESLKGSKLRMSGIDRYFELNDVKLENPKYEKDPYYIDVKEKLSKTIA